MKSIYRVVTISPNHSKPIHDVYDSGQEAANKKWADGCETFIEQGFERWYCNDGFIGKRFIKERTLTPREINRYYMNHGHPEFMTENYKSLQKHKNKLIKKLKL